MQRRCQILLGRLQGLTSLAVEVAAVIDIVFCFQENKRHFMQMIFEIYSKKNIYSKH